MLKFCHACVLLDNTCMLIAADAYPKKRHRSHDARMFMDYLLPVVDKLVQCCKDQQPEGDARNSSDNFPRPGALCICKTTY